MIKLEKKFFIYILLSFSNLVFAQDLNSTIEQTISLGDLIMQGGWAMYPLGLFSLALFYFIIRIYIFQLNNQSLRYFFRPILNKDNNTATSTSSKGDASGYPKFHAITITNQITKIFM